MLISLCGTAARPAGLFILGFMLAAGAGASNKPASPLPLADKYKEAVASAIRTPVDRDDDAKRKPLEFLQFTQVQPGMRVLDVSAGDGYTTQLLALVVGSKGTVWAQAPQLRKGFADRLQQHPQSNIEPVVRPFEDPVPSGIPKLDLITLVFNYHDIAYLPVDRAKMNRQLFDALKPGGHLVVLDHSAKTGTGTDATKTLHRIDETLVVRELLQAGFQLEEEGSFVRNPADPRDQRSFDATIPVDNFALRFVKP